MFAYPGIRTRDTTMKYKWLTNLATEDVGNDTFIIHLFYYILGIFITCTIIVGELMEKT